MTDTVKVHIGMTSARELELDVIEDDLEAKVERAIAEGGVLWLTDEKGHRHGIVVDRLAFFEIETEVESFAVGFGASD